MIRLWVIPAHLYPIRAPWMQSTHTVRRSPDFLPWPGTSLVIRLAFFLSYHPNTVSDFYQYALIRIFLLYLFFCVPTSPEWKIPPWPLVSLLIPSNGNDIITYSNQIALIANWQAEFRCCRNWKQPPVGHQQLLLARVDKYNEMSSWLFSGDRVAAL